MQVFSLGVTLLHVHPIREALEGELSPRKSLAPMFAPCGPPTGSKAGSGSRWIDCSARAWPQGRESAVVIPGVGAGPFAQTGFYRQEGRGGILDDCRTCLPSPRSRVPYMPYEVRSPQRMAISGLKSDMQGTAFHRVTVLPPGIVVARIDLFLNASGGADLDRFTATIGDLLPRGSQVPRLRLHAHGTEMNVEQHLTGLARDTAAYCFPEASGDSPGWDPYSVVQMGAHETPENAKIAELMAHLLLRIPTTRPLSSSVVRDFQEPDYAFYEKDRVYVRKRSLLADLPSPWAGSGHSDTRRRKRIRQMLIDGANVAIVQDVLVEHLLSKAASKRGTLRRRSGSILGRLRNRVWVPNLTVEQINLAADMAEWGYYLWPMSRTVYARVATERELPQRLDRLSREIAQLESESRIAMQDAKALVEGAANHIRKIAAGVGV